ncbi:hypothetical protein [Lysinibacillus xylanilyticus]
MKNNAMKLAAIATLLSCTAISPLFASAEEKEKKSSYLRIEWNGGIYSE